MPDDPLEMTQAEYAEFVDRQIAEADRQALRYEYAIATNRFSEWWVDYTNRIRRELEEGYARFQSPADGRDGETGG